MNLWLRIKTLIRSKLWRWRGASNPQDVLRDNLAQMEKYLQDIKKSSLRLGREKGNLNRRLERLNDAVGQFEREAKQAIKLGRDKQAELALKEKYRIKKRKDGLKNNIKLLNERIESLEQSKNALKNRIQIFRTKEVELQALQSASEAELRIHEISAGISGDLFSNIDRAVEESEKKLQKIQSKIDATQELINQEGFINSGLEDLNHQQNGNLDQADGDKEYVKMRKEELERLKRTLKEKD